ncbi:MAG: tryptophan synthase subunit alpha [Spirochaetota bacterium]
MNCNIMAHMVAFYPDGPSSISFARALVDGGAGYLEVQFPFSDPQADGTFIQRACTRALEKGFRVSEGFKLLSRIRSFCRVPIFLMAYANTLFVCHIEKFLMDCITAGIQGVIVPDLTPGCDEGIFATGKALGIQVVPVVAPTISRKRLHMIFSMNPEYMYASLRKGITGSYTNIGEQNINFLKKLSESGAKILAGFGISERKQVELLSPYIDAAVVGSAFIKEVIGREDQDPYTPVLKKIQHLHI